MAKDTIECGFHYPYIKEVHMSAVIGVMVILMVVGFFGLGHHRMMGGHEEKNEAVVQHDEKAKPCLNCPVNEKDEDRETVPAEKTIEEGN